MMLRFLKCDKMVDSSIVPAFAGRKEGLISMVIGMESAAAVASWL